MEQTIQFIPTHKIVVSPLNPRKTIDEASIKELADNIERQGLLQPITIRPMEYHDEVDNGTGEVVSIVTKYEIVCGERRYRAWLTNQRACPNFPGSIPCIVREMSDEDALDAMITENLQRKDVDPMEEAFAFSQLLKSGKTVEELSLRFGKSKRFIADRVRLDKLIPEFKKAVTEGKMNIGAAMLLCKIDEDKQREFLEDCNFEEMEDGETVIKDEVEDFIDRMFMTINRAPWKEDFEGSCGCTCEKCQFNNSNAGCLFYEMKISKNDASCTNRDKFEAKRLDWLKGLIDENADVLVKAGCELETGKTVICTLSLYGGDGTEFDDLVKYCDENGYRHEQVQTMFNRWSSYAEGDPRLQEKLDNNEVYRVLVIEKTWQGASVYVRHYEVNKSERNADETRAMQLVNEYKDNLRKSNGNLAKAFRTAVHEFDTSEIAWKAFTDVEWQIFLTALISSSPYTVRESIMGKERDEVEFVKAHNTAEERDRILRVWLSGKLSDSGVEYYPVLQACQSSIIDEWGIDASEVKAKAAEKLAKKQEPIEKELLKLGYDTEGKKLDF